MFKTKDSGSRAEFPSGMVRDTQEGKPRFDLIFPEGVPYQEQMLTRFAELMARGAVKYDERNWEKASTAEELGRARSSALRHMIQWYLGEGDEDHAAAVMFNIMAAEYVQYRLEQVPVTAVNEWREARLSIQARLDSVAPVSDGSDAPFTEDSATGGSPTCEWLGQHKCRLHPTGYPTAIGTLKPS